MNMFLDKIKQAHSELVNEKGDFLLFACVELEVNQNEWDVVVCAEWLPKRKRAALEIMVDKLEQILEEDDFLTLSRVIILNKEDPFYCELTALAKSSKESIYNTIIAGLDVKEVVILQIQADDNSKSENEQDILLLLKNNPQLLNYIDKMVEEKIAQRNFANYIHTGKLSTAKQISLGK